MGYSLYADILDICHNRNTNLLLEFIETWLDLKKFLSKIMDYDAWQKRMNLYRKGIIQMNDALKKLNGDQKMPRLIMQQQMYLNCLGFNCGAVNGIKGIRTANAIAAFMLANKDVKTAYPDLIVKTAKEKLSAHVITAASYLGEKEIPGLKHNNKIVAFWQALQARIRDDETPYCSAFMAKIMTESYPYYTPAKLKEIGITPAARSWHESGWGFGSHITIKPCIGDIAVLWRQEKTSKKGHVTIAVGYNENGDIWGLGGNEKNSICVSLFPKHRVLSFRRSFYFDNDCLPLPLITEKAVLSYSDSDKEL